MIARCVPLSLLVLAFPLAVGCHPFEHQWQQAAELAPSSASPKADPTAAAADTALVGRWSGHWYSHDNGHNGPLRAIVTVADQPTGKPAGKAASGPTAYRVQWHAVYAGWLQFGIDTPLSAAPSRDRKDGWDWTLTGQEDLGVWGVFRYTGSATDDELIVDYVSPFDRGVFRLERVPSRRAATP